MRYEAPSTTREASALLANAKGKAVVLAGGTDLLARLKSGDIEPDLVVDIKRIDTTQSIKRMASGFRIGASVPCVEIGRSAALKRAWPGVVEAAQLIGSDQIQGRCTIAGNLCNASPAADSVPALIAAGAKASVVGTAGRRTVAVEKITTGPGKTSLGKDEIVESINLPKRPPRTGDAYLRFTPRTEMDIAVVGAGVCLTLNGKGEVSKARVVLGAVAPTAVIVADAANAIIGSRLEDSALAEMAAACEAACNPIDDMRGTIEFRTDVSGVLAKRAAKIAYQRAGGK
ncbi:MAG: xanthine dehydrogenase family protein subunit M [Pseudomonadales bacterium]|jgi:carbon-monoxide dehydrogenase medium subunit|nr:xanthine dehydrogenase family protein subunit M [Pseudomonadales bacterium]MDP6470424.1 xanthine dehydrogenase family protein subunit M [Pseudomonadales bacterium]MDP6827724.1 xanthine dehydrogenase family protein subunit M [Pseudomonadales bacterium]MDP6973368.1 xanthine dehydrogenase family protein subunit M [Pseudomonadales bacterium]|tara:strand:+ start:434 stop:1294 length:861 start_codon:yes stop_codon:yes gene_type:complete